MMFWTRFHEAGPGYQCLDRSIYQSRVCTSLFERCARVHSIICSEHILGEFRHHLFHKFHYSQEQVDAAVNLVRSVSLIVIPAPLENPVCRDPDDDPVLATALAGKATCIVTGDKDLLVLGAYLDITILRPSQFADFESADT